MRAHKRRQVPVEIVRRYVDLVRLGHVRDLHALRQSVPRHVDDSHVHRAVLEEGAELPPREQRFAARHRSPQRIAYLAQARRVVTVDLEPHQPQIVQGAGHLQIALGLEVEIEVEKDVDVLSGALAQGGQLLAQRADHAVRGVQVDPVAEAGHVQSRRRIVEQEDVGLQPGEAAGADFAPQLHQPVRVRKGRDAHRLGAVQAVGPAMGPVKAHALPRRPAEQRVNRHAQVLRLHVQKGVLERRDRLLQHAARRLAGARVEMRDDLLDGARVDADQPLGEAADNRREAAAAVALVIFGIADDAGVGLDLEKGEHPPAGVAMQVPDRRDLHGYPLSLSPEAAGDRDVSPPTAAAHYTPNVSVALPPPPPVAP